MSQQCPDSVMVYHGRNQARDAGLALKIGRLLQWVEALVERHRQRRALLAMDDRSLRDIGLSRADVDRETTKPVWRP